MERALFFHPMGGFRPATNNLSRCAVRHLDLLNGGSKFDQLLTVPKKAEVLEVISSHDLHPDLFWRDHGNYGSLDWLLDLEPTGGCHG